MARQDAGNRVLEGAHLQRPRRCEWKLGAKQPCFLIGTVLGILHALCLNLQVHYYSVAYTNKYIYNLYRLIINQLCLQP